MRKRKDKIKVAPPPIKKSERDNIDEKDNSQKKKVLS